MMDYRDLFGAVYILHNEKANRVKVGTTFSSISGRLKDVNDMWSGERVTCQICGGRRLKTKYGKVPVHAINGRDCPGSNTLPFEKDSTLAKSYVDEIKALISSQSGVELCSFSRKLKSIEKRIEKFRKFDQLVGKWITDTVYFTNRAGRIELSAHKLLAEHLDHDVHFGEVFKCSVMDATIAIEQELAKLNLMQNARKEVFIAGNESEIQNRFLPFK